MIFELIVVSKDDKLKEINIVVWNHQGEIEETKYFGKPLGNIGGYKLKGIIKDYEIVFQYIFREKTIRYLGILIVIRK